jgi:hypothetical protein
MLCAALEIIDICVLQNYYTLGHSDTVVMMLKLTLISDTQHMFICVSTMTQDSNAQLTTDSTVAPPPEEKFVNDPYSPWL